MNLFEFLQLLQNTIRTGRTHQDYKRVTKLAWLYKILVTGVGHEKLLERFNMREDDELFAQRVLITQTITPAAADSIMHQYRRLSRLDNIKREISYATSEGNDAKKQELEEALKAYHGHESLEQFLDGALVDENFLDPNSFIVTTFDSFDYVSEKPKPYPVIYDSTQAIDFEYKNNVLNYLIIKEDSVYETNSGPLAGHTYTMYLKDEVLRYVQVEKCVNERMVTAEGLPMGFVMDEAHQFNLEVFHPLAGRVQAIRPGYKKDLSTKGRTFVSPFHAALGYFLKTVKSVSEMDLTMALHCFPQKVQYAEKCPGESPMQNILCLDGMSSQGGVCRACQGKGFKVHKSAMDALIIPLPADQQDMMDLTKIVVYNYPPMELLDFQNKYIEELKSNILKTVFNSDTIQAPTIEQTATAEYLDKEEMHNTLFPFTEHYAHAWGYKVDLVATFLDIIVGLNRLLKFPSNLNLKSLQELYLDLKAAKEAGAPAQVLRAIGDEIAAKQFKDNPKALAKYRTQRRFTPFSNMSDEAVWAMIYDGTKCSKENEVLFTHADIIFEELEMEVTGFFDMEYSKQLGFVNAKVKAIILALPKPEPVQLGIGPGSRKDLAA